jgi:hypothetical protein
MLGKAVRKQFYLRPEISRVLAEMAREQNLPEAEIIRRALEEYMLKQFYLPVEEPISRLAGLGQSGRKRG